MHYQKIFYELLQKAATNIHRCRLNSLIACVESVLDGAILTVTDLGRHIKGTALVKHKIKRSDRLLNNRYLYEERLEIYKATADFLLTGINKLVVLVDWSPFKHKRDYGILRASIGMQGRSFTLYQETFIYAEVMRIRSQKRFLKKLKQILPADCKVIIVTDMGFQSPWFRLVRSFGWDFIGRIRKDIKYFTAQRTWQKTALLRPTRIPQRMKNIRIFAKNSMRGNLVLYQKKKAYNPLSKNPTIKQYQKAKNSAWILLTSTYLSAKKVCAIYRQRMLIETSFRDVKSQRFGMGLNLSLQRTNALIRREILLLIAHVAHCILFIIGWLAWQKRWHLHFQVNSIKYKRIYSLTFLGLQVISQYFGKIRKKDFLQTIRDISFWLKGYLDSMIICGDN
jgi:hypothetical protein